MTNGRKQLSFILVYAVLQLLVGSGHAQYTTTLEVNLLSELYNSNYSSLVRPSATVMVRTSFVLYTINDLSIVDQTLSISGMLSMKWFDKRLAWDHLPDYQHVQFIFDTDENTWTPAVFVENSVEDLSVLNDSNMPMRITPNGEILRDTSGIFKVSCECDITYYPLDKQVCFMKITTGGYTQGEIDLEFDPEAVDLSDYVINGEWKIVAVSGSSTSGQQMAKTRKGLKFASLSFRIELKRRHLFHILNTVFPVFLVGMLIPFVYQLKEVSDRIAYSLTVLLSYAVYLSMIAANVPSTSVSVCYLSVYLVTIFTASTFSIVFVIWIAKIADYESNMSPCTKSIASWLARIPCCGKHPKSGCRRKRSVSISAAKGEELRENGRFSRNNSRVDSDPSPDNDAGEICGGDVITWQDFASSLDQILFVFFFIFIAVSSLVLFIFWGLEYERNN